MELKDFILAVFEQGKSPEALPGIKPLKKLEQVHDLVTIFFVDRRVPTVSALRIDEYFPVNGEIGGVIKGEWDLGGYNEKQKCFFSMGKYPVIRSPLGYPKPQTFVSQDRLNTDETYIQDHLEEFFGED